jgi:hypothetical protein
VNSHGAEREVYDGQEKGHHYKSCSAAVISRLKALDDPMAVITRRGAVK